MDYGLWMPKKITLNMFKKSVMDLALVHDVSRCAIVWCAVTFVREKAWCFKLFAVRFISWSVADHAADGIFTRIHCLLRNEGINVQYYIQCSTGTVQRRDGSPALDEDAGACSIDKNGRREISSSPHYSVFAGTLVI